VIGSRIPFRCGFPRHGTLTLIIRSFMAGQSQLFHSSEDLFICSCDVYNHI